MRKKSLVPFILCCVSSALSGIGFGVAIAIIARIAYAKADVALLPYAFYTLIAGIAFVIMAFVCLLFVHKNNKPKEDLAPYFLEPKADLLTEEEFLEAGKKNPTRGMGCLTYSILSSLSEDERTEICPRINETLLARIRDFFPTSNSIVCFVKAGTFFMATDKGDIKAKMEEVSRQALNSIALDPTMPDIRLLLGLESESGEMDPALRLSRASRAAHYDGISRLSGSLAVYDKAMEIDSYGLSLNLQEAIEEDRLEVGYIPLLNKNNKTAAYLRRIRLFDPSRGLIEEDELRRLADNAHQGEILDEFALNKAFEDLRTFDEGTRHHLPMIILSLGRATFYRASFLQELRKTCAQKDIELSRICLAFPGSMLESDEAYCANFSKKAHNVGLKTAVLGFSAKCPLTRFAELLPDVVSLAPNFAGQDPRLGKAKIDVLKISALTIESKTADFGTVPDLYELKEVTPSLALERLQHEEEFLR